ncbi:monosaccharide ABC transporter substrate-binding protein, CUT2 family [Roseovarius azorensis]|uniref:Monosaccharide ABC transporter substrate-binding protein, CUT2 family n=1 Tax=Roseovarius azorensis TaxID=1287727 RepID=A0A1H7XRU3_9RHOB|nr:ABC transporter substrate-binding protein [Roseovarius azorensis]SEM36364.1 monosaccharide ABC transporter substrate-binding protein, CUT2 family [Roseovarius azorensis]
MTAMILRAAVVAGAAMLANAATADVSELPEDIRNELYNPELMDPNQPLGDSAYRDFVAKNPPPWKIGYASSYAGNTWRAAVMDRLQNTLIPKWKGLGLIEEVIVTQSNLNDATQIQQIRQLVDQGVDAIIVCCSNPTALNAAVEYAYNNDVAVFSGIGYLTSPYSVNSSANFVVGGRMMGEWMAEEIGGEGTVLNVEGIPGASASDSQNIGIEAAMLEYPDITVKGPLSGMWTDQVAQAEVQRWLATNPGKLDGIIIQSASELGALRALQQSGRPMVPITIGSEEGALCYWRNNPNYVSAAIHAWPPGDDFEMIWNIMMRTLQGQGPKIQSILTRPVMMSKEEMLAAIPQDCSEQSSGWYHPGIEAWAGKEFLDNFFLRPADPEAYDPASHPAN